MEGAAGVRPPWEEVSREVDGLDSHARYEMWVKASTRVGEGAASRVVSQAPSTTGKRREGGVGGQGQAGCVWEGCVCLCLLSVCVSSVHTPPSPLFKSQPE